MWYELIGLPGVGKTTLIEKNIDIISTSYFIVRSKKQSLIERLATRLLYLTKYRPSIQDERLAAKLAYRHSFRTHLSKKKDIFFYDSGLLQVVLEYFIETHSPNLKICEKALENIHLPDQLLFLQDDVSEIVKRELQRRPRRFKMSEKELQNKYFLGQEFIENTLLSKVKNHQIIIVSNADLILAKTFFKR